MARTVHAPAYAGRGLELAAVVGPNQARAEEFCRLTGFRRAYSSVRELLAHERIDLASVCTPNRYHCGAVVELLAAGVPVLCEKPPGLNADEARQMMEESRKLGVLLAYDLQQRFSDEARLLKDNLWKLGEVYVVEATALRRSGVPGWGSFTDKATQGGGPLIDIGIHVLDLAMYLLGFPRVTSVEAVSFQRIGPRKSQGTLGTWDPARYTVEDALFGTLRLEGGGIIRLSTSYALNIPEANRTAVSLCGEDAGATLYPAQVFRDVAGELELLAALPEPAGDYRLRAVEAFVDAVAGRPDPALPTPEQGWELQRLIDAMYRSAEVGEPVRL